MAQTIRPLIGFAFYIGLDGSLVPALGSQNVIFVERKNATETMEQALARVRSDPTVVKYTRDQVQNVVAITVNTPTDTSQSTAIVTTTPSANRPASLKALGISRDRTSRETRLWFDNVGGAAALKWIVTDLLGKRIPGAGWNDQAIYQAAQTDFLPYAGYTSSARLSPQTEGVGSLVAGQTYLVGLQITNNGVTDNVTIVFGVPTESTYPDAVAITLPPLAGGTGTDGTGTNTPTYRPENYTYGTADTPMSQTTDEAGNAVVSTPAPNL